MFLLVAAKGTSPRARARSRARAHARTYPHAHAHTRHTHSRASIVPPWILATIPHVASRTDLLRARPDNVADRYHSSRQRAKPEEPPDWPTPIDDNNKYGVRRTTSCALPAATADGASDGAARARLAVPPPSREIGRPRSCSFPIAESARITSASTGSCVFGTFQNGFQSELFSLFSRFLSCLLEKME